MKRGEILKTWRKTWGERKKGSVRGTQQSAYKTMGKNGFLIQSEVASDIESAAGGTRGEMEVRVFLTY